MDALESDLATCPHSNIRLESSAHAFLAGYKRPTTQQRLTATVLQSSKDTSTILPNGNTFPAPLILPDDDLALDPKCPPQSLRQWARLGDRNPVSSQRRTVYVAASPEIGSDVGFMRSWLNPASLPEGDFSSTGSPRPPKTTDVAEYLTAYYHGMVVKLLPLSTLTFANWDTPTRTAKKDLKSEPRYVGLNTSSECIRIRTRASKDRVFPRQLNLDDLLDAAIAILPDDAYALVMLVAHDLYESAEDEFVCGRAYGGSRVAVVSSARYNPNLDSRQGVERAHAWPASHCEAYLKTRCNTDLQPERPLKKRIKRSHISDDSSGHVDEKRSTGPLTAALIAHRTLFPFNASTRTPVLDSLWLGRMCRTAAHELGHCFGMDHCVYYACSMQGSSSLQEDARQPPYICPVDLAKMLSATGADPMERYEAIAAFCKKHPGVHLFDAFRAWLLERLKDMKDR